MNKQETPLPDRREWLRTAARWSALGGLGALGFTLLSRGVDCRPDADCRGCRVLASCRLPRAEEARRSKER